MANLLYLSSSTSSLNGVIFFSKYIYHFSRLYVYIITPQYMVSILKFWFKRKFIQLFDSFTETEKLLVISKNNTFELWNVKKKIKRLICRVNMKFLDYFCHKNSESLFIYTKKNSHQCEIDIFSVTVRI